jgi:hypothetical protein
MLKWANQLNSNNLVLNNYVIIVDRFFSLIVCQVHK